MIRKSQLSFKFSDKFQSIRPNNMFSKSIVIKCCPLRVMVSLVYYPKNIRNMKLPKSNGKSRRNRYCIFKDPPIRSPKKPIEVENDSRTAKVSNENKSKSGTWKRTQSLQLNTADLKDAPPSSSISQPGILYSDVLFTGENSKSEITIRTQEPRHLSSLQSYPRIRKKIKQKDRPKKPSTERTFSDKMATKVNSSVTPLIATDLREYISSLGKRLNVEIPSWNFTDIETFDIFPKFTCQFDDYNYLTCEKVAQVGLRLASDGKIKS